MYLNGEAAIVEADPSPLFEAVGALIRLFEAARAVVESRVKPPYGVEAAGLCIDTALYARLPFGLAPGMGENAFIGYTVIPAFTAAILSKLLAIYLALASAIGF